MQPGEAEAGGELRERSRGGAAWGPLVGGLLTAGLVFATLLSAVFLSGQDQRLAAGAIPPATATRTAAAPSTQTLTHAVVVLTVTPVPLPSPTELLPSPTLPSPVPTMASSPTPLPTLRPSAPAAQKCLPPSGWRQISVKRGETLYSLALRYNTTDYMLLRANCLTTKAVYAGQRLYVPGVVARYDCIVPQGWVLYQVQWGDTLYSLSIRFRVTVAELKRANCLASDTIYAGVYLRVPYIAPTATRRPTQVPVPPSQTPPAAPTGESPTTVPSETVPPEPTDPPTPTDPPVPTDPPTQEPTATTFTSPLALPGTQFSPP